MAAVRDTVRVAVVGTGYWGIHHVRVFSAAEGARVSWICDPEPHARHRAAAFADEARATDRFSDVISADDVDAVVLATPAATHADLGCRALEAGKHVLIEKPVALSVVDAERVKMTAERTGRVVLVGHLMLYHPVVRRLRHMLASGDLGDLYYLYSSRVNLGRLRHDENALWSLAPHDVSMIDFLLGKLPESVTARGQSYLQPGVDDVVFLSMRFADGQMAHVHLSWLDPRKERRLTLVCAQKMVEFDDVGADKLRIYDKGYDRPPAFTEFSQYLTLRQGDIQIPYVPMEEPLAAEARHFLACIRDGLTPLSDASSALRVVRVLAAGQASLDRDGAPIAIAP